MERAFLTVPDLFRERFGISKPSLDTDIIFHCRAGVRSLMAIEIASKLGYLKYVYYTKKNCSMSLEVAVIMFIFGGASPASDAHSFRTLLYLNTSV